MAEVCVAPGTLGAATDQSSCKTNLTLAEPPPHLLPPKPLRPPTAAFAAITPSAPRSQMQPARRRAHKSSQTKRV